MRVDKTFASFFLGLMGLFLFICLLLVFIFPVITTLFTVFTGVILPESYYLAGNPNSGWLILIIDTSLVCMALWLRKQK
jgi:hypothetical protein